MSTATPSPIDPQNIQGDILSGLPKKTETYIFFQISDDVSAFRSQLTHLVPLVTSTAQVLKDRDTIANHKQSKKPGLVEISGLNIAFSQSGLTKMGLTDDVQDAGFKAGMLADAQALGDAGTTANSKFDPNWVPAFKNPVHGIIFLSGDCHATVSKRVRQVEQIFKVGAHDATIHEVLRIVGDVRPDKESGHEHFGFLDGISNPSVQGFDSAPPPGAPDQVQPGVILLGRDGDSVPVGSRPSWTLDGSFLAFRYLFQLVPEFNEFLEKNPVQLPGLTPKEGSEFLGARLVGRWKSGAPLDLAPLKDDPALGADSQRNNSFNYTADSTDFTSQTRCPFAAHVRKTNPRNDLKQAFGADVAKNRIIRRGVQFGPELTELEKKEKKTQNGRGLLFVSYQSTLANGFQFLQKSWANQETFLSRAGVTKPGLDPIIGQSNTDPTLREMVGSDPNNPTNELKFPQEWVVPRGGEYFFSPSIPALRDTIAEAVHIAA
ncbi:DyP-type peroxidase [Abortiporus biennis]|nr:DyP-type peroxidase [Abortiporus biennis]